MRRRPLFALIVGLVWCVGTAACSEQDGRTLPPPDPSQTTVASTPVIQPGTDDSQPFTLQSTAFGDLGVIPDKLTCTGEDISPDLSWVGTPADAVELALVVRDLDAGGFLHWIVTGIDPTVQGFGEGGVPEGVVEHANDAGTIGWSGPCPPAGSGAHTYELSLHALDAAIAIPDDATPEQAASLIEASSLERAVLSGTVTAGG